MLLLISVYKGKKMLPERKHFFFVQYMYRGKKLLPIRVHFSLCIRERTWCNYVYTVQFFPAYKGNMLLITRVQCFPVYKGKKLLPICGPFSPVF